MAQDLGNIYDPTVDWDFTGGLDLLSADGDGGFAGTLFGYARTDAATDVVNVATASSEDGNTRTADTGNVTAADAVDRLTDLFDFSSLFADTPTPFDPTTFGRHYDDDLQVWVNSISSFGTFQPDSPLDADGDGNGNAYASSSASASKLGSHHDASHIISSADVVDTTPPYHPSDDGLLF